MIIMKFTEQVANAWVQLANGKVMPYYGPEHEYEDIVMKVLTSTIRPMSKEERQRAIVREQANKA